MGGEGGGGEPILAQWSHFEPSRQAVHFLRYLMIRRRKKEAAAKSEVSCVCFVERDTKKRRNKSTIRVNQPIGKTKREGGLSTVHHQCIFLGVLKREGEK